MYFLHNFDVILLTALLVIYDSEADQSEKFMANIAAKQLTH